MNAGFKVTAPLFVAVALAACNSRSSFTLPVGPVQSAMQTHGAVRACPQVVGQPACSLLIQSRSGISASVAGWGPATIQARYHLPSSTKGKGQIVAIVQSFDNPNVASDLATYRKQFHLGTSTFRKYNQRGQQSGYPQGSPAWGADTDVGVQMVAAACPKCTIYLIEANSQYASDLGIAVAEAVALGAHIVSTDWQCYGSLTCFNQSTFDAPGVVYVAGAGNLGYNDNGLPEAFGSVVSVGGTVLFKRGSKYVEQVWDGSGGGCSSNGGSSGIQKPAWQKDPDCNYRTDADVSALAWDVAEYDSYDFNGWMTAGGPAVSTPLIAAVFALAGNASKQDAAKHFWVTKGKGLNYISSGEDGSCKGEYLCEAGTQQFGNYSGPAGWGTPNGVNAF